MYASCMQFQGQWGGAVFPLQWKNAMSTRFVMIHQWLLIVNSFRGKGRLFRELSTFLKMGQLLLFHRFYPGSPQGDIDNRMVHQAHSIKNRGQSRDCLIDIKAMQMPYFGIKFS